MDVLTLSFSIVIYDACREDIECFFTSLIKSICHTNQSYKRVNAVILLIDNSPQAENRSMLEKIKENVEATLTEAQVDVISGHGNIGFGAGHNLCIERIESNFHFVLNSDLLFEQDVVTQALDYLGHGKNSETVLVAPKLTNFDGSIQYGIKSYPSLMVLMLRLIGSDFLSKLFETQLYRYEERAKVALEQEAPAQIISGCFMLFRTSAFKALGGFDERFFLYFEDFDLSLRAHNFGNVVYNPKLSVAHFGGGAGKKGWKHINLFIRSAAIFFRKHGWKWF